MSGSYAVLRSIWFVVDRAEEGRADPDLASVVTCRALRFAGRTNAWRAGHTVAGAVLCGFVLAATVLAGQGPVAVERPTLAALLARAGEYATGSLGRLASVVAEERYVLNATYLSSDLS